MSDEEQTALNVLVSISEKAYRDAVDSLKTSRSDGTPDDIIWLTEKDLDPHYGQQYLVKRVGNAIRKVQNYLSRTLSAQAVFCRAVPNWV